MGACVAAPAAKDACDSHASPKCDGAKIKYCFAGKQRTFNCNVVNFSKCEVDERKKVAHCTN